MQVKGTVKVVSDKTKGLMLKEQPNVWYNPTNDLKPLVSKMLQGKVITLNMSQKPFCFDSFALNDTFKATTNEVKDSQPTQAKPSITSTSPFKANIDGARVGMAITKTEKHIIRQTCIKAASEYCSRRGVNLNSKTILDIAAEFEKWVLRD